MADDLMLTLTLECAAQGSEEDRHMADAFIAELVADLNGIEAVSATSLSAEEAEAGSKALGAFLLGVLTAEVNGENAMKVIRYLRSRFAEQPQPIHLKLSRKEKDGREVEVEVEGSASDIEAIDALLSRLEASVQHVS